MQTTFMEAVSITLSSMAIVLATLALIAFILGSFKHLFKEEKPVHDLSTMFIIFFLK